MRALLVLPIRLYQLALRPILPQTCRFYPSCSDYAITAIKEKGILKGSWLAILRLTKCQPFHHGGYDPVTKHG